jgi:hypothetical protein
MKANDWSPKLKSIVSEKRKSGWKPTIDLSNVKKMFKEIKKWMTGNDRNEETEIDHWSVTENYWSKPMIDIRKLKLIISERRKTMIKANDKH